MTFYKVTVSLRCCSPSKNPQYLVAIGNVSPLVLFYVCPIVRLYIFSSETGSRDQRWSFPLTEPFPTRSTTLYSPIHHFSLRTFHCAPCNMRQPANCTNTSLICSHLFTIAAFVNSKDQLIGTVKEVVTPARVPHAAATTSSWSTNSMR